MDLVEMMDKFTFDGETFNPEFDGTRLNQQLRAVFNVMKDGQWRTLTEIRAKMLKSASDASISARLRDLRKERFGLHQVERRRRGMAQKGVHEYKLIPSNSGLVAKVEVESSKTMARKRIIALAEENKELREHLKLAMDTLGLYINKSGEYREEDIHATAIYEEIQCILDNKNKSLLKR